MDEYIKVPFWLLVSMKEFESSEEKYECLMAYLEYRYTGKYAAHTPGVKAFMKLAEYITSIEKKDEEKNHE